MEFFRQWCFSVCVTLVIAVIFSLFTPRGRMKDFYKTLIAVFVFVSFVSPFSTVKTQRMTVENPFESVSVQAQTAPYEEMVSRQVREVLKAQGITGASVSCKVGVNYDSGEISVESVQVAVPDGCDTQETETLLLNELGIRTKVKRIGE